MLTGNPKIKILFVKIVFFYMLCCDEWNYFGSLCGWWWTSEKCQVLLKHLLQSAFRNIHTYVSLTFTTLSNSTTQITKKELCWLGRTFIANNNKKINLSVTKSYFSQLLVNDMWSSTQIQNNLKFDRTSDFVCC